MPWKMLGDPEEVNADARRVFQEAESLREKGDKKAALRSYEEAARLDDGFIRAYYWILKLTAEKGIRTFSPEVRNMAARVLVFGTPAEFDEVKTLLGEDAVEEITDEIIANYETFASVLPDDYDARYELACFLGRVGHTRSYIENLEKLIAKFPDRNEAYITLYFHYEGEDPEEAAVVRKAYGAQFGEKALSALDEIARSVGETSAGNG